MSSSRDDEQDSLSLTSYNRYPAQRPLFNNDYTTQRPLINDDYTTQRPSINDDYQPQPPNYINSTDSFPENNRQAVLSAMRKLQDKIRRLDIERTAAESNLRILSDSTRPQPTSLRDEIPVRDEATEELRHNTRELQSHLSHAGSRVNVLEKRLEDMRQLVEDTEERVKGVTYAAHRPDSTPADTQLRKISDLEREHHKLSATQTIAQDKLKELEEKLNLERTRKTLQDIRSDKPTISPKLVDFDIALLKPGRKQKVVKKKRRDKPTSAVYTRTKPHPGQHYRVKLSDIPFVAGKSTSPSHSLGANVQRVIAMMKSHNDAMCSQGVHAQKQLAQGDVTDVLNQLQKEFNQLTQEHDFVLSQMNSPSNDTDILQTKLEDLITRMELKSDQIAKLRKYQQQNFTTKGTTIKRRPQSAPTTGGHTTIMTSTTKKPTEVRVTTTIRTKRPGISVINTPKSGASLNTLKYMKKLQTTLRPNDLSWE